MKTFTIHGLAAILLVGLMASASAQSNAPARSTEVSQIRKNVFNSEMVDFWNGNYSILSATGLLNDDDFRAGVGISDEQRQIIQDAGWHIGTISIIEGKAVAHDPDVQLIYDEKEKFRENSRAEGISEEIRLELQMKIDDLEMQMGEIVRIKKQNVINETLTPDQLQKVKEFQISMMSEFQFVSPNMFEALGLSDAQKEQLNGIKKDMESEFAKEANKWSDVQQKLSEKLTEAINNLEIVPVEGVPESTTRSELANKLGVGKKVRDANPDLVREQMEAIESGKRLSETLKIKMFDVLTDEQWVRMVQLIDNPPDYVKKILRKWRPEEPKKSETWVPGPGAWQPGSSVIPEQYRQERNTRRPFPRGKN